MDVRDFCVASLKSSGYIFETVMENVYENSNISSIMVVPTLRKGGNGS